MFCPERRRTPMYEGACEMILVQQHESFIPMTKTKSRLESLQRTKPLAAFLYAITPAHPVTDSVSPYHVPSCDTSQLCYKRRRVVDAGDGSRQSWDGRNTTRAACAATTLLTPSSENMLTRQYATGETATRECADTAMLINWFSETASSHAQQLRSTLTLT